MIVFFPSNGNVFFDEIVIESYLIREYIFPLDKSSGSTSQNERFFR